MSQLPNTLQPVERAIADLRRGATIVLLGADRALLVHPAEGLTASALARIAGLSKATPSLLLTARRAAILKLTDSPDGAVRISLSGGVTADTVRMMADPAGPQSDDLAPAVSISHIDPATRPGASEIGAIELLKLACLLPAAVVAPVPDERLEYLSAWAETQSLLTIELDHVRNYQEIEARTLQRVGAARVPLEVSEDVEIVAFRPSDGGREHLAIVIGDPPTDAPVLVRLHSECFTGDLLGSLRCDCGDQLRGAVQEIGEQGGGIVLYLAQEGRGIGLINKLRAYTLQDHGLDTIDANQQLGFEADERLYRPAAEMLRQLGIQSVRLLTNNPDKVSALREWQIDVTERVSHSFPSNQHNEFYLATKQSRAGHLF
ncbi:MAG: GTP cyclohydrolase II [Alphaproteobacteria bacterium]|nr:GTP cyclohydrolase II [Alphaproteobacteria bacterium]|tara:strand:- start:478 stop:1602 length:1125 start_codon:yes stop_codon:yes gene_type:complete